MKINRNGEMDTGGGFWLRWDKRHPGGVLAEGFLEKGAGALGKLAGRVRRQEFLEKGRTGVSL